MRYEDDVPPELVETVARLQNWGQWAQERGKRGRASSAEGRYRPRWGNNASAEEETRGGGGRLEVDQVDAQLVGRILAPASGMPERMYLLLKGRYIFRSNKAVICRHLAMHPGAYLQELERALWMTRARLTRYTAASYSQPVTDATSILER